MSRDALVAAGAIVLVTMASGRGALSQAPATNGSGNLSPSSVVDPAAIVFTTDTGLMLHAVKSGSVADYEAAMRALQGAMAAATDEPTRQVASGWRLFKVEEAEAKPAVLFVHVLQPVVPGVDYRPSLWLDKLLGGAPLELLTRYRDALAAPPTKLGLSDFANMTVLPPTNASPPVPGNVTPPKPPGVDFRNRD